MKKYKKVISVGVVILIVVTSFLLGRTSKTENEYLDDKPKQVKEKNLLSYYLENENGEYEAASGETWPTEGYKFNATLSKCENGGELGWDDTNKVITMTGNMSDKCYIYFDKVIILSSYVKALYTGTQGENNIYYHDGSLENGINDGSYRYAGASDEVNNYVCFGSDEATCPTDNLYRIIGVFGDQVKLIKSDYANSNLLGTDGSYGGSYAKSSYSGYTGVFDKINKYYWSMNDINTWSESNLNTVNLNKNFITYLNNINTKWANMIAETTWKVGGNTAANIAKVVPKIAYQYEITSPDASNSSDSAITYGPSEYSKIGLMYVSDYGFAADPAAWTTTLYNYNGSVNGSTIKSLNWMYMGIDEWTISRRSDDSNYAFHAASNGIVDNIYVGSYGVINGYFAIRPVFYLVSSATYLGGDGTSTSPYRIN